MDLQLPSFPILLSFFLFVFILLKRSSKTNKATSKLPPGPWKLPFIGNLHQLASPNPHHVFRDLANKYGPLMYVHIGEIPTLIVSSTETATEVLRTHDTIFASRPSNVVANTEHYAAGIVFAPYGEYWRQVRKICTQELLSAARVQSFRRVREEETFNLMEWIASKVGSDINLTEGIHSLACALIARAAFGKKSKDQEEFISFVIESTQQASGFHLLDLFPSLSFLDPLIFGTRAKLKKLHDSCDRVLEDIIREHTAENRAERGDESETATEDLLDILLKFHNRDVGFSLSHNEIKAVISDIFVAGADTAAIVLDWAMAELAKNPRVMKKVQNEVREVFSRKGSIDEAAISEMTYLKLVVKETLRLHPPGPMLVPRECTQTCEINGYVIPEKTRVMVNAWAIGRDPKYWTEPDSFIPERFFDSPIDYTGSHLEYIPFGAGRRTCPGRLFGLIGVEFPLAMLLYHFDWKLPGGMKHEDLDMTELFGITVTRKKKLHLIPSAYDLSPIAKATRKSK